MINSKIIREASIVQYVVGMWGRCRDYGTLFERGVADTVIEQATWVSEEQWFIVATGANRKPTCVGGPYQHPDEMNSMGG